MAVYLGNRGWSQQDIGFVLSAAGIAGLLSQIPGGELLDATLAWKSACGLSPFSLSLEFDTPTSKQELHRGVRPRESVRAVVSAVGHRTTKPML